MTSPPGNSIALPPNPARRALQWIAANPFLVAGAIYLLYCGVQFAIFFARAKQSEWDNVFVYAGKLLITRGDIYGTPPTQFQLNHPYTYPPFHAILAIPFTFLPRLLSSLGWLLITAASLIVLWILSWRIAGGQPLTKGRWTGQQALICILGLSAGMRYAEGTFGHQQSDILIDALLVAGCFAWQRRRDFLAASAWGFAAAFKGPPLIMAPYLAWRGRWLAAIWTIVLAVGLNLVPDLIDRAPHGIWLTQWYTRVIAPVNQNVGEWYVDVTINQSLAGAAHRIFTTRWWIADHAFHSAPKPEIISPRNLKLLVYAIDAGLLLLAALAMNRPFKAPPNAQTAGLECALVFILMLLLSPMSHKTHFGILMLPGFFVARMAIEHRNRLAAICMLLCFISIGLLDRDFFAVARGDMFAWYGNVMWGAVALGAACLYALARNRKNKSPV